MTLSDQKILDLVAQHRALEAAIQAEREERVWQPMTGRLSEIERSLALLVPTTAEAAIEQIDILSEHDDAGIRALNVLRGLHALAA
jgi:hypothetical protein